MMTLWNLLNGLKYEFYGEVDTTVEIEHISFDSRAVWGGVLFCCLVGREENGHKYIDEVIRKGATAIVFSDETYITQQYGGIQFIKVEDTRNALAIMSSNFWNNPSDKLEVIGITGTNGKTSISHYIQEMLSEENNEVGLIGTTGVMVGTTKIDYKIKTSTTPDPMELHEIFHIMQSKYHVKTVVMEATSHALELNKLDAITFDIAIFSNLTQDHLDFHETMEKYLKSKLKLMKKCKTAVINLDSEGSNEFIKACKGKVITYSIDKPSDYQAFNVKHNFSSVEFDLLIQNTTHHFEAPIPGDFTVYNTLSTIVACLEMGMNIHKIKEKLKSLSVVPGRMQTVKNELDINIIVDYAHSPDSLMNILSTVKDFTKGRLITVVGCGGNRDREKRPKMGLISYQKSDILILTSDNPRNEFPDHIIIEMLKDISTSMLSEKHLDVRDRKKVILQPNRRDAIFEAINDAQPGDCIVIAGKGHENYQELKNKVRLSFDDYLEAENIVKTIENLKLE